MSIWNAIYGGAIDTVHKVDKKYLGSAIDGLVHPKDEVGHFARGWVDNFTGGALSSWDATQYTKDYLRNTGMSWGDIKYGSRTGAGRTGGYVFNVSKNITRLYKR